MARAARAIAAAVLRPSGSSQHGHAGELVADEPLVAPVGDDRDVVGHAGEAGDGAPAAAIVVADQGQERLGAFGSAQRVEPRPAAAGHDHGVHVRPILARAATRGRAQKLGGVTQNRTDAGDVAVVHVPVRAGATGR